MPINASEMNLWDEFYPDPEYGGFFALLGAQEAGALPEAILTTIVTTIILAALPERFRRPLW